MRKRNFILGCSVVGMAFLSGLSACSGSKSQTGANGGQSALTETGGTGNAGGARSTGGTPALLDDAGCVVGAPNSTYVLIDDMETTSHGPIEFDAGIAPPLFSGFWYNSGAS